MIPSPPLAAISQAVKRPCAPSARTTPVPLLSCTRVRLIEMSPPLSTTTPSVPAPTTSHSRSTPRPLAAISTPTSAALTNRVPRTSG